MAVEAHTLALSPTSLDVGIHQILKHRQQKCVAYIFRVQSLLLEQVKYFLIV